MRNVARIAGLGFSLATRTRIFWVLVILAAVLAGLRLGDLSFFEAAREAGEWERVAEIRASGASSLFHLWGDGALLVGLVLGATAVSSDLRRGALEAILAWPVARSAWLLGRWLGIQLFLLVFLAAGLGSGLLALGLPALEPTGTFWLGLAYLAVRGVLAATLGLAFGTVLPPVPAGACALLLLWLPTLGSTLSDGGEGLLHGLGVALYYMGPAELPGDMITAGLTRAELAPDHRLELLVLVENALYAVAALVLGNVAFERRDLPGAS